MESPSLRSRKLFAASFDAHVRLVDEVLLYDTGECREGPQLIACKRDAAAHLLTCNKSFTRFLAVAKLDDTACSATEFHASMAHPQPSALFTRRTEHAARGE